jgi:hypothetical protein
VRYGLQSRGRDWTGAALAGPVEPEIQALERLVDRANLLVGGLSYHRESYVILALDGLIGEIRDERLVATSKVIRNPVSAGEKLGATNRQAAPDLIGLRGWKRHT